jgi:hypothetical protein
MTMKPVEIIKPGHLLWVMDDCGFLKMISVDSIYWNDTEDESGWDIVSDGETYWIEYCFELESKFIEN